MIDWSLLYNKFGKKRSAEKFEDMALDYVRDIYSEYTWKPTGRTRDGNRDFHNLEDKLLNIWGEAKYKKNSISLTRKDLDPTMLSGLIDGRVQLIIFVTNGKIPDSLITRLTLGANMKGIKLSFVTGNQLSDWLVLNSSKYKLYFEEDINDNELSNNQLINFKKVSFFEPISLDFRPNFDKICMNVGDIFILNCLIFSSKSITCKLELENDAPLTFIDSEKYESPRNFDLKPGLNAISFLVKANQEYRNILRITLKYNDNIYHCISNKLVIKKNNQLNIYYFNQLDILNKIKIVLDDFDSTIGNYTFFIHGCSGMGKTYIMKSLSLDYCLGNDLTLVTFEKAQSSNTNYLLLCRIMLFLQFGNIFWNYDSANIKKFCINFNVLNGDMDIKILNAILQGCFDSNIAKSTLESLIDSSDNFPLVANSRKEKSHKILLLDDIQYLNEVQSFALQIILEQQFNSRNNNIVVLSGRKNEFHVPSLEKKIIENVSNYYKLDVLSETDIEGTILQNFSIEEKLIMPIVKHMPPNLLLLNELLSNLKYIIVNDKKMSNSQFIDSYVKLYLNDMIFQEKFSDLKDKYYLLDIIYLFEKGISIKNLLMYPNFNKSTLTKDIKILLEQNCVKKLGKNIILPFHDFMTECYRKLRKGKEYNEKTGDFLKFILELNNNELDCNYLLSIVCKCGKRYFNYYNKTIQALMLQYIQKSEYGAAIVFAELFYRNTINKKHLTKNEKYFLYLYADCLVHCDNRYRAKQILQKIADEENTISFEKYEAEISLLNQRFWSIDLNGIIEDSRIYQVDLENMFIDNLKAKMLGRFKKSYEACFNRRMVTLMLLDKYEEAQKTYQDGLFAIKRLSKKYNLNYNIEIATIIMDYARGNIAKKPNMAYSLFCCALKYFSENKYEYIRRFIICQIDLLLNANILKKKTDYKKFTRYVDELNNHNFLLEYIKGILKLYACRMIDYCRANSNKRISINFMNEIINKIETAKLENHIILQNREKYLYNYIMGYFYILQNEYKKAEKCLRSNINYTQNAGQSYKIPLEHNLNHLETIQGINWFQEGLKYSAEVYLLDSRFW